MLALIGDTFSFFVFYFTVIIQQKSILYALLCFQFNYQIVISKPGLKRFKKT